MSARIIEAKPIMLGIDLERPFPLSFGTLEKLPRVLLVLKVDVNGKVVNGIGEASIDFPFSHYDAWDIYHTLLNAELNGKDLSPNLFADRNLRETILDKFPAAFCAINMTVDDAYGKLTGKSILDKNQFRSGGKALASISFQEDTKLLRKEIENKLRNGFIPKPKVGQGTDLDLETINAVDKICSEKKVPYVLDFNAHYSPEEFKKLIEKLRKNKVTLSQIVFIEQPTNLESGISGLEVAKIILSTFGYAIPIVADESFVTLDDALECTKRGISLNYKIHKVGGRQQALMIESAVTKLVSQNPQSMVGGTFPTAIGRAYDQQVASLLKTATLPGDGWEPSTDWFTDEKHLIKESFPFNPDSNLYSPIKGVGLGITPDWEKINRFKIDNPQDEYRKIRNGEGGKQIKIDLKPGQKYGEIYKAKTGKSPDWNL